MINEKLQKEAEELGTMYSQIDRDEIVTERQVQILDDKKWAEIFESKGEQNEELTPERKLLELYLDDDDAWNSDLPDIVLGGNIEGSHKEKMEQGKDFAIQIRGLLEAHEDAMPEDIIQQDVVKMRIGEMIVQSFKARSRS